MLSIFLAKVLGLYLVIVGGAMLMRRDYFNDVIDDMNNSPTVTMILAIIPLMLGLLMVVAHNIWVMDWRVVVTILCWLTLAKGVVRLYFPRSFDNLAYAYKKGSVFYSSFVLTLALGVYLIYVGFML